MGGSHLDVVAARIVRLEREVSVERVPGAACDRRTEHEAHLVPVRERLAWRGREQDLARRARKAAVEPDCDPVHLRHLLRDEAEGHLGVGEGDGGLGGGVRRWW